MNLRVLTAEEAKRKIDGAAALTDSEKATAKRRIYRGEDPETVYDEVAKLSNSREREKLGNGFGCNLTSVSAQDDVAGRDRTEIEEYIQEAMTHAGGG